MIKKITSKFKINPEVIRLLTSKELAVIDGGGTFTSNPYSWCYSCKVGCTG